MVICEQYRDGIRDKGNPTIIPPLKNEKPQETLARKLKGARDKGWLVQLSDNTSFHVRKEYPNGLGTLDSPRRKDRYFSIKDE